MKQLCVVFVYICYFCVNEKYLFTKADYNLKGTMIPFNHEGIQIPCNHSLIIDIHNVTVPMDIQSCKEHQCLINTKDMIDIAQRCNGANICKPNVNLTTECLREQTIARYQISYGCEVMCSFESDQCQYVDAVDDGDMLNWTRTKVNAISGISVDYPSGSENGSIMYFESNKAGVKARMKIPTTKREGWICVNFWYIDNGAKKNPLILYQKYNDRIKEYHAQEKNKWINVINEVYIDNSTYIIFEANFRNGNGALGLDDISISMNKCTDPKITYSQCGYWNADLNMTNCPTFFISRLQILFTNNDISPEKQNCTDVKQIASDVKTNCLHNYRLDYCVINLSRIVYSSNHTCLVPHKSIYIEYFCKEKTTSVAILTQTVSSTPIRDASNPMYTIVIVSVLVILLTALGVITVVCYRMKTAKPPQHIGTRQDETANDMTDSTDYTAMNYNEMRDIDISKINEKKKDKITTHRNLQGNNASAEKEENNCYKYKSLATIRNSEEHVYESGCAHDNQYQSLTNQRELDEHAYESTEHASAQYQSLTNRSESDNHAYESTSLHTDELQNKK